MIEDTLYVFCYGQLIEQVELNLKVYHQIKSITHFTLTQTDQREMRKDVIEYVKTLNIKIDEINISKMLLDMLQSDNIDQNRLKCILKVCATIYGNELHTKVQLIRKQFPDEDWNKIIVAVTGPPSPRPGHSAMQYFERLTGELSENDEFQIVDKNKNDHKKNRKLYYVENIYDPNAVLKIIAQMENERREYDKILSMKTDIMAYDTREYLQRVCGNSSNSSSSNNSNSNSVELNKK